MHFNRIMETLTEIKDALIGSRIERIDQLDGSTILMTVCKKGKSYSIILSVRKKNQRFHLVLERIHRDYLRSSPGVEVLRKYLANRAIAGIAICDQAIIFGVNYSKRCNLIADFYAGDIQVVDDSGDLLFSLNKQKPSATFITAGSTQLLQSGDSRGFSDRFPLNEELSAQFFEEMNTVLQKQLLRLFSAEEKMVNRLLQKLLLEQEEVDVRERYRKAGELLKYNLLKVEKGQRSAELVDFDGKSVRVDLDPKLSPRENMEYCFQKYRKLNKKEKVLLEKVRRENSRLRYILDQKQRISKERLIGSSGSLAQFFGSLDVSLLGKSFLRRTKQLGVKSASKMRRTDERYFTLTSQTGKNILIGRNAEENDELLRKVARGNDLWFHVESGQGSHVFLRYDKRGQFREEDVRDASLLALYFSKLRNEKKGNVVYTYCKYVQRPKGARTGRVIYRNHKTRFVTEHKGDLKRLLNAETSLVE